MALFELVKYKEQIELRMFGCAILKYGKKFENNILTKYIDLFPREDFRYYLNQIFENTNNLINNIKSDTVLIVELNRNAHSEILPAYAKYFLDLGFNVDVALTPENLMMDALCRVKNNPAIRILEIDFDLWNYFFKLKALKKYKKIMLVSHTVYCAPLSPIELLTRQFNFKLKSKIINKKIIGIPMESAFVRFPALNNWYEKMLVAEHHVYLENKRLAKDNKLISLGEFNKKGIRQVNPHYFGEIKKTDKNSDVINFIVVGHIDRARKNTDALMEAVKDLHNQNIRNFKITVIGYGDLKGVDKEIANYFDIKGRINFPNMYNEIEKADFLLPLLDPDDEDHEKRYLKCGFSGSIVLIYGFLKLCLIAEKFAPMHGLSQDNSIVYKENSDLAAAMKQAIDMNQEEYQTKRINLENYTKNLYNLSLENLKELLDK